jgi:hypothetical protein
MLTNLELAELRRKICKDIAPDFDKLQINAALQATVDWLTNNRPGLVSYVNKEVKGYAFKSEHMDKIVTYCLEYSFKDEEKKFSAAVAMEAEVKA